MAKKYGPEVGIYTVSGNCFSSMRVNRKTLTTLKELVSNIETDLNTAEGANAIAGKLFVAPLKEESRAKFPNPETAPHFFLKYLSRADVEEYAAKNPKRY